MSSVPDNYEINVAKKRASDGRFEHYARIQLPDIFEEQALDKLFFLRELFGSEYKLDLTHWVCRGEMYE